MISFTEPRQGFMSLYSSSNPVLMLFVVSLRNDDKRLVFFPLESTLRKLCFVKFPMPGNFQYLIVNIRLFCGKMGKMRTNACQKWRYRLFILVHFKGYLGKKFKNNFVNTTPKTIHYRIVLAWVNRSINP